MSHDEGIRPSELFLQINITSRCNLACAHCYVDGVPRDMDPDLFAQTIRRFEDLRSRLGVRRAWIQISGGEPMLHPRLDVLLRESTSRFPTKILTNATTIDRSAADMIAGHHASVQVSFDGDKEVHDARRGAGSFDAAYAGLLLLKQAGVPLSARITVGSDNVHCVEPLFRALEPSIDAFHASRVVPIGGCGVQMPDTHSYRKVIYRLYAEHAANPKVGMRDPFFAVLMSVKSNHPPFAGCSAGISGLCVAENGDIYPCRRLPVGLGNIGKVSLTDVYFGHPLLRSLRRRDMSGRCGGCEHRLHCGGSRCIAYAVTGDPLASDPGCIFA